MKNAGWGKVGPGSIVCVVNSSRKISTFWRIDRNFEAELEGEAELQQSITGIVVAMASDLDMTPLLNKFKVNSRYQESIQHRFNVADLGSDSHDLRKEDSESAANCYHCSKTIINLLIVGRKAWPLVPRRRCARRQGSWHRIALYPAVLRYGSGEI